jgi:hypothetical protein
MENVNTGATGHGGKMSTIDDDADEEIIQLYPRDTEGSNHIVFDGGRNHHQHEAASTHAPPVLTTGALSKHHSGGEAKDPTVKLTSPGRLPKWMLLRSRDSLFCPKNMLFERRKKKQNRGSPRSSLRTKTVTGVGIIGTHFAGHIAAMANRFDQKKAEAKNKAAAVRRMRRARRAREKLALGHTAPSSRPSSAVTTTSASSRSSAMTDDSTRLLSRLQALDKSAPPPPPGWQEHLDLQTGRVFYVELTTGKTTWENPSRPKPRRVESRGMITPTGAHLHTPVQSTRVKQDWRMYLPPPETET